jgi:hypothetical protein
MASVNPNLTSVELSRSEKLNFTNQNKGSNCGEQCRKTRYHQYDWMLQNVTKQPHSIQAPKQKKDSEHRHDRIKCGVPLFENQSHS